MFGTQNRKFLNTASTNSKFRCSGPSKFLPGQKHPHHYSYRETNFQNNRHINNSGFRGSNSRDNFLQHWCETCDRGFKTAEILESHISEHQKCGIDGCKFVAHPKVVTKHIEMQHSTGLFNRIKNLETPEDIASWISERKKKYPSKENIEKQKAVKKECLNRGEKLKDQKSRFNNRRENKSNFKDKRNRLQKNNIRDKKINTDKIQNLIPCIKIVDPTEEETYFGIPAFKGTSHLECFNEFPEDIAVVDNKIEIEDDEWEERATSSSKTKNTCQALSTLMSAYQSSSEEEIEKDVILIPKTYVSETITKNSVYENKIEIKCANENNDDDSGPESVPIERSNCLYSKEIEIVDDKKLATNEKQNPKHQKRKHSDDSKTDSLSKKTRQSVPLNTFQKQLQYYKERPSTLLEKLLEKDIRHERNVILQCINYIIKNDYFKN